MYREEQTGIDSGIQVDLEQAAMHVELLTGSRDTRMTWQTVDRDPKRKPSPLADHFHGSLAEVSARLIDLNRRGAGVFFMVNAGDFRGRSAENVNEVRALFVDSDSGAVGSLDEIVDLVDPDWTIESSAGKWHGYRRVGGFPVHAATFKSAQQSLAAMIGGDTTICDLPRIMRVAGFVHQKVKNGIASPRFLTRLHEVRHEGRVTSFDTLLSEFGWTESNLRASTTAKKATKSKPGAGHVAVGRGDDPFTAQIADGEGRNAHVATLAGICAVRGLGLDTTLERVSAWNAANVEPIAQSTIVDICTRIHEKEAAKRAKVGELIMTEAGFADWLVASCGDRLRYVRDQDRWIVWDGRSWSFDDGDVLVLAAAKQLARSILGKAAAEADDGRRDQLKRWHSKMESAKALKAAIYLARSEPGIAVASGDLDRHHMLLGVDNGTVDLGNGALREARPDDLMTQRAFVTFDRDATCPRWLQFLDEITLGDHELGDYLQRLAGYCATGSTREHAMVILVGTGANGKSIFSGVLSEILGMYSTRLPASALAVRRNESLSTDVAALKGARIALASELPAGMVMNDALVKALTSDDSIVGRLLYRNAFTFKPTHKMLLATNHLPIVPGTDEGVWRRVKVMRFNAHFPEGQRDPKLMDKLLAERNGILNWLIEGAQRWLAEGLNTPDSVKAWTGEYRESLDVIGNFIDGACRLAARTEDPAEAARYRCSGAVLLDAYTNYAKANGLPPMSGRAFGEEMAKRFPRRTCGGLRVYDGIAVVKMWLSDDMREKIQAGAGFDRAGVVESHGHEFAAA